MSESHPERRPYDPPMSPDQNYVEINAYVVGWGLFFAALFSLAVGYLCLKIGQTVDAFAPVSVLAMGMAVLFKRKNAFPETVHIQAIASAGTNIIGGVMFILPALFILQLDSQLTYTEMVIPIVLGGVLGVLLATTFRRYFCEEMDAAYPFPSGRAAADHGYPLAVADGADRLDVSFAKSGLYDGGFVLAYRDRLVTAQFQHTAFLTESGADASGKLREVAGLLQHVEGFAPSAFIEQVLPFGLFVT